LVLAPQQLGCPQETTRSEAKDEFDAIFHRWKKYYPGVLFFSTYCRQLEACRG